MADLSLSQNDLMAYEVFWDLPDSHIVFDVVFGWPACSVDHELLMRVVQ